MNPPSVLAIDGESAGLGDEILIDGDILAGFLSVATLLDTSKG